MGEAETRQKLLRNVKKEVKQIMEEAVTRKFVHADSSHIISFCAVVEACVLHGLKRRIAGLLCSNKVAALFMKVAKSFSPAEQLCQKVQELEQLIENSKQNNSSLSNDRSRQAKLANLPPQALKHLWIRTALMEKLLDKIVLYLVENSSAFYEKEAMLLDPVDGPILASLLVGPCALEYTKVKTADHFWTDPSADELVQRHRIHSGHCRQDSPSRRPALIQKRQSSGSMDDRPLMWVREYVESLHQNSRTTLLFGKNNVLVQPRDDMEAIPGYLSLHQTADVMTLKWTPNQLMNGNVGELDSEKSVYWDYAMTIRLEEIVYLHCHQQVNSGGTVVLVSQDGIQRPPLHFPKGGHLLQFLTCLETGLLPHGQLDPPLWNQRGKGKVFPKLRKRSPHGSCDSVSDKEDDEATDYVFRILFPGNQMEFMALELMDQGVNMWQPTPRKSSCSSCSQNGSSDGSLPNGCNQERAPLKLLCDTMKYQIISRAFYGWLAYCRHLSTVRTHLSALVKTPIVDPEMPCDARGGLSVEVWGRFLKDSTAYEEKEIHRLVYFGGVAPSLRKEVWPFLLGHYQFSMTEQSRLEIDEQIRTMYEQTMKEWQGCEAIVRQREREKHAEALARCSSGASVERVPVQRDSTISTDSSLSSSSDQQNTHSQSDSSSSAQVFESVETEPRPEEGDAQHSSPVKANLNETTDNPQPPSSPDFKARPLVGLAAPPISLAQREKMASEELVLDHHLDTACNTSPEGTDLGLSEEEPEMENVLTEPETTEAAGDNKYDESSEEQTYSQETLDMYLINLHRIDKDVRRCDRTYWYFTPENLEKLRNIMCSYVWQHLDTGYVQGMCDLLAPLLVILDDEVMAFSCFTELMKRMNQNFPHGGAMDSHFANMRSLIQILDSELFELMQQNGDYTHFYFCYRWFLLDFKREMVYDDVFSVWETIWAAKHTSSEHFVLFIALALVEMYRDIILENNMDFTDIIKFFNEMAERHNVPQVMMMARDLVHKVQTLIENK
ncbi:small G protein signaling modulator 1 isoform X3 [Parambassis ranga]|uniref:Small G protein signaling modulator 1 isoform X3 n=1 Tax=Parambassis ranga TaxID=210632 RepID=A0A6P7JBF2_9TELE|nr:small G protein signaling modulator 1-like isoform X3 [Parambassis ranga]